MRTRIGFAACIPGCVPAQSLQEEILMTPKHDRRLLALAVGAALSLSAAGAFAQPQIEEIMVTAQKREQSLQDVPVAVSAFAGT